MTYNKSIAAFQEAQKSIPGGVNSPVRSFKSVGGNPLFISKASGSKVTDIDGNEFIDYVGSWGPMILGHTHPDVVAAIQKTAALGASFGAPTLLETEMAELIKEMVPSIDSVRMVNSGTEATMSALRLARGYTDRDLVIKARFKDITKQLVENEAKIAGELLMAQGQAVDIGGYYFPDVELTEKAMRPSVTLNQIIENI